LGTLQAILSILSILSLFAFCFPTLMLFAVSKKDVLLRRKITDQ